MTETPQDPNAQNEGVQDAEQADDQDAEPASQPTGAAAYETAPGEDPDSGPSTEAASPAR